MTEETHIRCPDKEGCGSSDAYCWNQEKEIGHCKSCDQYFFSRDEPLRHRPRVETKPVFMSMRSISEKTMEDYGVYTYVDDKGKPVKQEYVYPSGGKKVRHFPKGFHSERLHFDELFGMNLWNAGGARFLTVTEGELDALSAYQMLKGPYANPVVSLPSATSSKRLWEKCSEWINSFEKIILSVDSDEAGDAVASKMANLFPNKVYRVQHDRFKDANDFLEAGEAKAFKTAWFNAKKYVPDNILNTSDQFIKLYTDTPEHMYVPTGIQALDDRILGIMQGQFTVIKAKTGVGKSLSPDTKVLKYNGEVVRADEVFVGDRLMGPDSKPRNVVDVNLKSGPMYRITPVKGEPFECNADHILSLRHTSTGDVKNVVLTEYLDWTKTEKHKWKMWRVGVEFQSQPLHSGCSTNFAYTVGAYLGDGCKHNPRFTLGKKKQGVIDFLIGENQIEPLTVTFDRGCYYIPFSKKESLWTYLQSKGALEHRHIPMELKAGPIDVRRSVLSGLLDTDGSLTTGGAEITQKSECLSDDICFVARSLGLAAYKKEKFVKGSCYYRVGISGDLTTLPCKRLRFNSRNQIKSVLNTGFKVEYIGEGKYRGIALDGDHLFLLGDFTVTHNTEVMRLIEYQMWKEGRAFASWHLEETKLRNILGLVSYHLGENLTRRDLIEEKGKDEEVKQAIRDLTEKEKFYQFELTDTQTTDDLIDQIKFFKEACDCDYVFFEPIQDTISGRTDASKEEMLADLSVRLSKLAASLNVGIITIAHTNDDNEIKYCRMIGQRASVIINLERDKEAEDYTEKNTTYLTVEKNRPASDEGPAGKLLFNPETFMLREV